MMADFTRVGAADRRRNTTMTTHDGMQLPKVSVVITTKNRSTQLAEAIESALALDRTRFDLEIIVVDDGSTDDTPEVLQRYPVRVIRTEGVGMARARSIGLEAATGDFFGLLDDDDVWLPTAITTQLTEFERHPEYGAVHAQAQMVGPTLVPFNVPFPPGPLASGRIFDALLGYFPQVGTILTRMDVAREAGPFDETLPGDNDWEGIRRVAKRHEIGAVPVPVLLFRQREEPHEELTWRRTPAVSDIFHRHTRDLPLADRLRLRPLLWKHKGFAASVCLDHAQANWRAGQKRRAVVSVGYAARISLPHATIEAVRRTLRRP